MSLASFFKLGGTTQANNELPEIYTFPFLEKDFISIDVQNIYSRILTDVVERTQGIPEKREKLLWDNCVASESQDGLISMIAKAMAQMSDLFIVFDPATEVVRRADGNEAQKIRKEYEESGRSSVGYFITFKNYRRTQMVKLYSALEYCTVSSLYKSMNLSKAIQIKVSDLRASVGAFDSEVAKNQGVEMAKGLAAGKDVMTDVKDVIETAKPDLTSTQTSMEFIAQKQSFYLGMPDSYITGIASKGISDTGQGDAKAVERGLKGYYFSIIKPAIEAIFETRTTFKSDDNETISSALEVLKTFELTGEELISLDNKQLIINKVFGLPKNAKGDEPKEDNQVDPEPPNNAPEIQSDEENP